MTTWWLECYGCGAELKVNGELGDLLVATYEAGWQSFEIGDVRLHYCPQCVKQAKQEEEVAKEVA